MTHAASAAARLALAIALVACAGCSNNFAFSVPAQFQVTSSGSSYEAVQPLELHDFAGTAWDHRGKVTRLDVEMAEATISALGPGNVARTVDCAVWLRPDGAADDASEDVLVGRFNNVPVTLGVSPQLAGGDPRLSQALKDALKGSGRLSLRVVASSDQGPVDFTLQVGIEVSVTYKVP
jgi:hypothetical protein